MRGPMAGWGIGWTWDGRSRTPPQLMWKAEAYRLSPQAMKRSVGWGTGWTWDGRRRTPQREMQRSDGWGKMSMLIEPY